MTMQTARVVFGAAVLAWLAGCTTAAPEQADAPPEVTDRPLPDAAALAGEDTEGTDTAGTTGTLGDPEDLEGSPLMDADGQEIPMVIYFDFDSSEVHPDDRVVVEAHAQYLARDPDVKVDLEGHADERGSREYNVALGERRAIGVRDMLRLLGVGDHQVSTVSYGEERPAMLGHEETSWSQNRRVEFVYLTR